MRGKERKSRPAAVADGEADGEADTDGEREGEDDADGEADNDEDAAGDADGDGDGGVAEQTRRMRLFPESDTKRRPELLDTAMPEGKRKREMAPGPLT